MQQKARISSEPVPPTAIVRELIQAGAIDPDLVRLPALERCRCGHVPEAHGGPCRAKKCPCTGFDLSPLFRYDMKAVTVQKLRVGEDGSLTRV